MYQLFADAGSKLVLGKIGAKTLQVADGSALEERLRAASRARVSIRRLTISVLGDTRS